MFRRQPVAHVIDHKRSQDLVTTAMQQIFAQLSQNESVESLYQFLVQTAMRLFEVDSHLLFIRIADPATGKTKFICTVDNPYEDRVMREDLRGIVGRALRTQQVQLVPDVRRDPDYIRSLGDAQSELVLPLMLGHRCYGVLNVESTRAHWFGPDDVTWGTVLATLAAQVAEVDEREGRVTVESGTDADDILSEIQRLLPVESTITIMRRVPKTIDRFLITAIRPTGAMDQYLRLRAGQGITAQAIITAQPFVGDVGKVLTHLMSTRSAIVIPIANPELSSSASGRPLGVLNIESPIEGGLGQTVYDAILRSGVIEKLTRILSASPSIEQRLDALIDVETTKTDDIYTQILTLVNDYVAKPNLAGAVLLLRDREENLAQSIDPQDWADDPRWIVVQGSFGAYSTEEPDRRLNRPSIIRRVINSGHPVIIDDVNNDLDYWSVGFGLRSMVAVPIFDRDVPVGAIEVLSPEAGALNEEDVEKLRRVAIYVGQVIKRVTDLDAARRAERKLDYTSQLRELTAPLYEWRELSRESIFVMREQVLTQILRWALAETHSQFGVIFEAETVEISDEPELVVRAEIGPPLPGSPMRLHPRADDAPADAPITYLGLVGKAFLNDQTQRIQEAPLAHEYAARYSGVQRIIAVPMHRGNVRVGVLDVETNQRAHYTVADRSWIEFFADRVSSALNTVEIALSTQRQVHQKALLRRVSEGIARLRAMDRHTIRDSWHSLRQVLLDEIRDITGATKVTIFTAVNAYDEQGILDLDHGLLIEATSSPRHRRKGDDRLFFPITANLAGLVFRTTQRVAYNRRLDRPDVFAPLPDQRYEIKSGVAVPIMEGARVVGVLQFDHSQSGFCTEENIASVEEAAQMAGDIIVASRIRLDEIQVRFLRDFELDILSLSIPNVHDFMLLTLHALRRVSNVVDGWGQVLLLRNYRMDDGNTSLRVERIYSTAFGDERPELIEEWPPLIGQFDHDHPQLDFALYREVVEARQMRLSLDTWALPPDLRVGLPWDDARSLICVPLIQPRESSAAGEHDLEVFGLFVVASRRSTRFGDNDVSILLRLARSVVIGYRNLGLSNAQKDTLEQLTHDLSKAMVPLTHRVEDLTITTERIDEALSRDDHEQSITQLGELHQQLVATRQLLGLSRDLIFWSIDLTDVELVVADEPIEPLLVMDVVRVMEPRMQVLAQVLSGSQVHWHHPENEWVAVQGSPTREKLIKATLFKYVENALKYGQGDVNVVIRESPGWVTFEVHNHARVIPLEERERIFELRFRGSNVNPDLPGSGTGLYQVRRTAQVLGGHVDYRARGEDENIFFFTLPSIAGPTRLKG